MMMSEIKIVVVSVILVMVFGGKDFFDVIINWKN